MSFSGKIDGRFTRYEIRIRDESGCTFAGKGFRLEWTGMEKQLSEPNNCSTEAIIALAAKFDQEKQKT